MLTTIVLLTGAILPGMVLEIQAVTATRVNVSKI